MLHDVEISSACRARIWIDEPGPAGFEPSQLVQAQFRSGAPARALCCSSVTVEVVQARGARAVYGLLGATLGVATASDQVSVSIAVTEAATGPLQNSIAFSFDLAAPGLRCEFVSGVLEGVAEVAPQMPAAQLHFVEAAETAVGSSPAMFRSLARSVCRIAACPSMPTVEHLKRLVRIGF